MSCCKKSSPIIKTAAASAAGGPPYAIPVAPLTSFYADSSHTAFVTSDDGGECDLTIEDLIYGKVVSDGDRKDPRPVVRVTGQKVSLRVTPASEEADITWHVPNPMQAGHAGPCEEGFAQSRIADYTQKTETGTIDAGRVACLTDEMLTNDGGTGGRDLTFYWVDKINVGEQTVSVTVREKGEQACTARVTFHFVGPSVPVAGGTADFFPSVGTETDIHCLAMYGGKKTGILKFGRERWEKPEGSARRRGMNVVASVDGPEWPHPTSPREGQELPDGRIAFIQLIKTKRGLRHERPPFGGKPGGFRCHINDSSGAFLLDRRDAGAAFYGGRFADLPAAGWVPVGQPGGPESADGPNTCTGLGFEPRINNGVVDCSLSDGPRQDFDTDPVGGEAIDVRVEERFELFLMYRPDPDPQRPGDGSVWVTLRKMHWGWAAAVSRPTGGWPTGGWPTAGKDVVVPGIRRRDVRPVSHGPSIQLPQWTGKTADVPKLQFAPADPNCWAEN